MFFDRYLSAESATIDTTRLPGPNRFATSIDAHTAAPALDPPSTPSTTASFFTMSNASTSRTAITSSASVGSYVFGIKLDPMPSTACGPDFPPPYTDASDSTQIASTPGQRSFIYRATPV